MNELVEPLYTSVQHGSVTRSYPAGDPHRIPVSKLHFLLFSYACAGLIAAHLLVIAFAPRLSDTFIYSIWAAALFIYGSIALMQARSTHGVLSLRWTFFALSLGASSLNYIRAATASIPGASLARLGPFLLAASTASLIVAITLPADSRSRGERALDASAAIVFCALRFLFELRLEMKGIEASSTLAHYTFDPVAVLFVAVVALVSSSQNERRLYRNIALYLTADFLAGFCINQLGLLWLHQQVASPWTLTETIVPLAAGIYLLGSLTTTHAQSRIQFRESGNPILRALVPFAMPALIVSLSLILMPIYRHTAQAGIGLAVAMLLARIAFTARGQDSVEKSLRYALRNQSWQDGPDPLDKVELQSDFGPALWEARATVSRENPLSLLIFGVEETADGIEIVESNLEGDYLIDVARHLCQWRPMYAKLFYMGHSQFAMLLPATSSRSVRSLASQIATGVEALGLTGTRGFVKLSVGSATALVSAEADILVKIASENLPRSRRRQNTFFSPSTDSIRTEDKRHHPPPPRHS